MRQNQGSKTNWIEAATNALAFYPDQNAVARFHRQAKIISGLHHKNILSVYWFWKRRRNQLTGLIPNKNTTRTESRWCLCYCLTARCSGSVFPHASASPSRGASSHQLSFPVSADLVFLLGSSAQRDCNFSSIAHLMHSRIHASFMPEKYPRRPLMIRLARIQKWHHCLLPGTTFGYGEPDQHAQQAERAFYMLDIQTSPEMHSQVPAGSIYRIANFVPQGIK